MKQNYLFIDIDGPLMPGKGRWFPENHQFMESFNQGADLKKIMSEAMPRFDPWCVRAHNLLAHHGQAKIVLVTNWRRWADIEDIQELFERQGLEFEYADQPGCVRRGFSSERCHDVTEHITSALPANSRALIIDDDAGLQNLNEWLADDNKSDSNLARERKNIDFKLLEIDYNDGITYKQWQDGMDFFNVDWDEVKFEEFGIPIKTPGEKMREREEFDRLWRAMIV